MGYNSQKHFSTSRLTLLLDTNLGLTTWKLKDTQMPLMYAILFLKRYVLLSIYHLSIYYLLSIFLSTWKLKDIQMPLMSAILFLKRYVLLSIYLLSIFLSSRKIKDIQLHWCLLFCSWKGMSCYLSTIYLSTIYLSTSYLSIFLNAKRYSIAMMSAILFLKRYVMLHES